MFGIRELNVAIELWGVAFCIIGIACVVIFARADHRYRRLFVAAFTMELLASEGDALAGVFRGQEGTLAWVAVHAGNPIAYIGNFALVAVLTLYLCTRIKSAGGPSYDYWQTTVETTASIMCILTLFGAFFYIDSSNVYHRGDWHWASLAYSAVVTSVGAALVIRNRSKLGKAATMCMLFYSLTPLAASVVQIFVYGLNFVVVAGVLGLVVVLLELQQHTAHVLVEHTEELARSRVEVAESRIAVMVSQIQPHFLFNTLDTIYGLVDEDTGKAKEAIASFSRYLRANLDSLKHTEPVPVEREMEHVRTYLELERASDESRLEYELDVRATGFNVPALSVQTLAENAVKHGLGEREKGGKVAVRTREQVNDFTVAVIDDGVGFDPGNIESDGVGLENTRARVSAMCGGELEVHSELGVGTTVIIHIPKEGRRSRS